MAINISGRTRFGPTIIRDGLVLYIDAANPKSFSPNAYPAPLDIFSYVGSNANAATITRDTSESSPAGGISLKMAIIGNDPYVASYGSTIFSFSTATSGQSWTVSCWIKASTTTTGGFYIFGADINGNYVELTNPMFTVTTSWQRFSSTITFSNPNTVAIQVRLEGVDTGGNGINIWFDGMQVERNSTATTFNSRYNQNGNNWLDLSGNSYNGTLTNGPTFNNNNGGIVVCDGVNDYVQVSNPNLTSSNYTVIGAGKYVTVDSPLFPTSYEAGRIFSSLSNNWLLGWWGGTTENYYAEGWVSNVGAGNSDTNWRIMAGTGNIVGDQYSLYTNGILTISNNSGGSQGPNGFSLGRYAQGNNEYANCAISFLLVYNRVLSASEVLQNYNALKSRFALR
jgi:hypothetical protein